MPAKRGPKAGTMTDEHKAALAQGRREGKAIREYLALLAWQQQSPAHKRGRKPVSAAELQQRLDDAEDPLDRVHLRAAVREAEDREARQSPPLGAARIEAEFVKHVLSYSERFGLTWRDWRHEGVPPDVLRRAGFGNSR